jgi:hypothetical protein
MRQIFCREGWERGRYNGIETIVHHDFKKMIAILNSDAGTADVTRSPKNRTDKGPAAGQVVDLNNQFEMFKRDEMGSAESPPYSLWYLCQHDNGKKVRAELSRPIEFSGGHIVKFSERIFILQDGDWEKLMLTPPVENIPPALEINVRRK